MYFYFKLPISGGSLTKIAYYSTVSYKRTLYSLDDDEDSHVSSKVE